MFHAKRVKWFVLGALLLAALCTGTLVAAPPNGSVSAASPQAMDSTDPDVAAEYIVLSWNDLGMHCYNPEFKDIGVLPPWNTLYAQVVRVGDPPQVITTGITVTFHFDDNTFSTGKSDFWDINPDTLVQNAQWLFNLAEPLPPDVGLTGTGLSGPMHAEEDHFVAEGIPLTEYSDSDPTTPAPYQLAAVIVYDATTGKELARTNPVAPVSTEMHCNNCHYDNGPANPDIATGVVEQNILTLHDEENQEDYPPGHEGALMDRRPVLCAECHASNALGAPGEPGIPSLSRALHDKHDGEVPDSLDGCYNCHPGPETECLRDVMYTEYGMDCVDCHGTMQDVSTNPNPWFNEPRCDNDACHGSVYQQDEDLYRLSREHGGVFCAACHDSPHAIAPSGEPKDAIKFIALQGHAGALDTCTTCHLSWPTDPGPHGIIFAAQPAFTFGPDDSRISEPGAQVVYTHTLENTGGISDTYELVWSSSQAWVAVAAEVFPLTLMPRQTATVTVTVSVPETDTVRGLADTTVVTATSTLSPTLVRQVTDVTTVAQRPLHQVYLPLVVRGGSD